MVCVWGVVCVCVCVSVCVCLCVCGGGCARAQMCGVGSTEYYIYDPVHAKQSTTSHILSQYNSSLQLSVAFGLSA